MKKYKVQLITNGNFQKNYKEEFEAEDKDEVLRLILGMMAETERLDHLNTFKCEITITEKIQ